MSPREAFKCVIVAVGYLDELAARQGYGLFQDSGALGSGAEARLRATAGGVRNTLEDDDRQDFGVKR
jgi:hypothetical protein